MVNKKTYSMVRVCINCEYKLLIVVPYGQSVPPVPEGVACPYCGCGNWSDAFRPDDPRAR